MRVLLTRREPTAADIALWRRRRPSSGRDGPPGATHDEYHARVRPRAGETPAERLGRVRARLLTYDIFPPPVMYYALDPPGEVTEGTTIVQRVRAGLISIEGAVQVVDVWDEPTRTGLRYVTLEGHPERGSATFAAELAGDGTVTITMTATSRAGTPLTRIGRPVARLLQRGMTRAALRRLAG